MKKLVVLFLSIVMVVSITGCGMNNANSNTDKNKSTQAVNGDQPDSSTSQKKSNDTNDNNASTNSSTANDDSTTSSGATATHVQDKINWQGAIYIYNGKTISGELIGIKFGVIKKTVGKGKLEPQEATVVPEGTMVRQVAGSDNITVKSGDKWKLYEKQK